MAVSQRELLKWISQELTSLLGMEVTSDEDGIAYFITSMQSKVDLEDYLTSILDSRQMRHKKFIEELLQRWSPNRTKSKLPHVSQSGAKLDRKATNKHQSPARTAGKSKMRTHSPTLGFTIKDERSKSPKPKAQDSPSNSSLVKSEPPSNKSQSKAVGSSVTQPSPDAAFKSKQRTVYKPLFTADGNDHSIIQIPGRHSCICQASKHKLVNNCLHCGRVVCEQEGAGPCFFCGNLVCSAQDLSLINSASLAGQKRLEQLMKGSDIPNSFLETIHVEDDESQRRAVEHKNKLINYDQTSARRTKVIDDESDYFNTDSRWLSDKDRAALEKRKQEIHERKHASRRDQKMTFDFAGRRVVEEEFSVDYEAEFNKVNKQTFKGDNKKLTEITNQLTGGICHPSATRPQFVASEPDPSTSAEITSQNTKASGKTKKDQAAKKAAFLKMKGMRLQDKELRQVMDQGMCMSMHQPWASLLIAGIKMHEGRSWYSAHRGRLWIASTVKEASSSEIEDLERFYIAYHHCKDRSDIPWPSNYPTACILGCVDVVDVLAQEEYRMKFPDGESNSPYVFICANPRELQLKFPNKGDHKIYQLDPLVHKSAKSSLNSS